MNLFVNIYIMFFIVMVIMYELIFLQIMDKIIKDIKKLDEKKFIVVDGGDEVKGRNLKRG